ncbi:MAG TPA: ferredoxin [Acidobacteriota bacterium]|jgi:ferredoxin
MGWKITVDHSKCIGSGICVSEAPNTFALDDSGLSVVTNPAGDPEKSIRDAAQGCPTEAITIVDEKSGAQVYPER